MNYPKFLKQGDCIAVPAPSAGASSLEKKNKFCAAQKRLESLEYKVQLSNNIFNCEKGRSASLEERAKEINEMFNSPSDDFVLCATGGDFLIEILPLVDFEILKKNIKFVAGFSDPTGLLYPITTKYDIATIYGQNFSSLGTESLHASQVAFLDIIKGNIIKQYSYDYYENEYKEKITGLEGYNLTEKVYWKTLDDKPAMLTGRIIGGCLDIISELAGTKYDGINEFNMRYHSDGIIWYFDNCELSMEETIRTLWKLNELDYFKYTKGIIFGRFGSNNTYYDYDVKACLIDSVISKLDVPIIYDADISHKAPCMTIINGAIAIVEVSNGQGKISFELK